MTDARDNANVVIYPPIAWALAFLAGLGTDRIYHLAIAPAALPHAWIGGAVFAAGFALAVSAIVTFRRPARRSRPTSPARRSSRTAPTLSRATRSTSAWCWARWDWPSASTACGS